MNLLHNLKQSLVKLGPFSTGSKLIEVEADGQRLSLELAELDSLACSCVSLALHTDALANATMERMQQVSADLAKRISYLLEPIGAVEADAEHAVVQMRSTPPQKDETGTSYYELLVRRGGDLRLARYQKTPGQPRDVVPAHLTREVLLRLAADFSAVAQ